MYNVPFFSTINFDPSSNVVDNWNQTFQFPSSSLNWLITVVLNRRRRKFSTSPFHSQGKLKLNLTWEIDFKSWYNNFNDSSHRNERMKVVIEGQDCFQLSINVRTQLWSLNWNDLDRSIMIVMVENLSEVYNNKMGA